jgi:hypothetical protein
MSLRSKWDSGNLVFYDDATGAACFTIKAGSTGVEMPVTVELLSQFVSGMKFAVTFPNIAAADVAKAFFVAPAACKVVSAYEIHGTVCDAADTVTIEKCTAGEDAGAGDVVLTAPWTMNSVADTAVSKTAVADGKEVLAAGDALLLKFVAGDGTNYAEGCVTVTMEWV